MTNNENVGPRRTSCLGYLTFEQQQHLKEMWSIVLKFMSNEAVASNRRRHRFSFHGSAKDQGPVAQQTIQPKHSNFKGRRISGMALRELLYSHILGDHPGRMAMIFDCACVQAIIHASTRGPVVMGCSLCFDPF